METINLPLEFQTLLTNLLADGKCACHVINPHKTRILMWKEVKDGKTTYYLRIGIQKFIAQEQIDRNGEIYWRYWIYDGQGVKTEVKIPPLTEKEGQLPPSELDPVTKFNQRQTKSQELNPHALHPNSS